MANIETYKNAIKNTNRIFNISIFLSLLIGFIVINNKYEEVKKEQYSILFEKFYDEDWAKNNTWDEEGVSTYVPSSELGDEIKTKIDEIGVLHLMWSYIFGAILGCSILPIVLWFIIKNQKKNYQIKIDNDNSSTIKNLKDSEEVGKEVSKKLDSLEKLKELNLLSNSEFEEKQKEIINNSLNQINHSNTKKTNQEIIENLTIALNNGIITKEEFEAKLPKE